MRNIKSNKVLFSAFKGSQLPSDNERSHRALLTDLAIAGVPSRVLNGAYKGVTEKCILLESDYVNVHAKNLELALQLAKRYGQESVLEVHNDGAAVLHRLNTFGPPVSDKIGTFHEATEKEALDRDAFTHDAESGRYYVVD
jgi:hypothetical protein